MIEAIGWTGAAAILLAHILLTYFRRKPGPLTDVLNLFGALGVSYQAFDAGALPPATLNAIWAVIAATAIVRSALSRGVDASSEAAPDVHERGGPQ
jgi:hypothetical protein